MNVAKGIPQRVRDKAAGKLAAYLSGEIHARALVADRGLVLEVGIRYRLICRKTGQRRDPNYWNLVTHEYYNRYCGHNH